MKILRLPVHSFLLAAYIPVWLIAENVGLFELDNAYRVILANLLVTAILLLAFRALYRDWQKAALVTTVLIALLFAFALVHAGIHDLNDAYRMALPVKSGTYALLGVILAIALLLARYISKFRWIVTVSLNAALATMLAVPLTTLTFDELKARWRASAATYASTELRDAVLGSVPSAGLPSIVHIALDGYSRQDVLRRFYGFDNAPFIEALRGLGFAVADRSSSAYMQTLLSMGSMFSGDYVGGLADTDVTDKALRAILMERIEHSPVRLALEPLGYSIIINEPDYEPVRIDTADVILDAGRTGPVLSFFEREFYRLTPLMPLIQQAMRQVNGSMDPNLAALLGALSVPDFERLPRPFLLYSHIVAPHPPFNVDRFGNARDFASYLYVDGSHFMPGDPRQKEAYRRGYVEKLQFLNGRLIPYLETLIARIPDPKVIIVHGDHGGGLFFDHEHPERTCLTERFSPLLAIYSSAGRLQQAIPHDFSLVNVYRAVFNAHFGTNLPLLPQRMYFSRWSDPAALQEIAPSQLDNGCPGDRATAISAG